MKLTRLVPAKRFILLAVFLYIMFPCSGLCLAAPIETAVPGDIFFCIKIDSIKRMVEMSKKPPLSYFMQEGSSIYRFFSQQFKEVGEKNGEDGESLAESFEKNFGIELSKLPELFPGTLLIYFNNFDFNSDKGKKESCGNRKDADATLIVEHNGDRETILEMLRYSTRPEVNKEGVVCRIVQVPFMQTTIYLFEEEAEKKTTTTSAFAFAGKYFVCGSSQKEVENAIVRLSKRTFDSLWENPRFIAVQKKIEGSDLYFYLDLYGFTREIEKQIREAIKLRETKNKDSGTQGHGSTPSNPAIPDPEAILEALSLSSMKCFYYDVRFDSPRTAVSAGLFLSDRYGLASCFKFSHRRLSYPSFVLPDAVDVSVSNFDIPGAYRNLEKILIQAVPAIGSVYKGYINQLKAQNNIDIYKSILGNIDSKITSFSLWDDSKQDGKIGQNISSVTAIGIKNAGEMESVIEQLKKVANLTDKFEVSDYLGTKVYALRENGESSSAGNVVFSYAFTPEYLFVEIGGDKTLKRAIAQYRNPVNTFWNNENVKKAKAMLPGTDCVAFSCTDMEVMLKEVDQVIDTMLGLTDLDSSNGKNTKKRKQEKSWDKKKQVKEESVSKPFKYYMTSKLYDNYEGIFYKAILYPKTR